MDQRELDEKVRDNILASVKEASRDKAIAEIEAREDFLSNPSGLVKCSCGLVMTKANFYEHRSGTKHAANNDKERIETCSCGLTMSLTNLREHQTETQHETRLRPKRRPDQRGRTRPTGIRPPPDFSFYRPDSLDEV